MLTQDEVVTIVDQSVRATSSTGTAFDGTKSLGQYRISNQTNIRIFRRHVRERTVNHRHRLPVGTLMTINGDTVLNAIMNEISNSAVPIAL